MVHAAVCAALGKKFGVCRAGRATDWPLCSVAAGVAVGQRRLHCGSGGRFGATPRMSSMKANVMPMMFVFAFFSMI